MLQAMIIGNLFQFHKGTIKTALDVARSLGKCHFNSIKVRLKQTDVEI